MNNIGQKMMRMGMVLISMIFLSSCEKEKDEVKEVKDIDPVVELEYTTSQNVIIQEFTSTGCTGCGTWGIPTFENFIKENPSVIPLAVHIKYGDRFITDESNALGNNRVGRRFTPQISIGHEPCVILTATNNIDAAGSIKKMKEQFDHISREKQEVKVGANYKIKDGKVSINYGGEVLAGANGEYFLTAYVMEKGFEAYQTGGESKQIHNHIIRASTDDAFGASLQGKMEYNKTITLDAGWDWSNVSVTAIIWKKNGNVYDFENAVKATKL